MEPIGKVLHRKLLKQESISVIARYLKLSRNTVRKYLKADTEPAYRRSVQPCPRLGDFESTLTTWLEQESTCQFDWSHELLVLGGVTQHH